MGIFDDIASEIGGNGGGSSSIEGMMGSLLGGGQSAAGQGGGMAGGLQGLLSKFEGAGMGGMVQSWMGNGANQPVSPDQLHQVLGHDQVASMAAQSGMEPHDFLSQLSPHLPGMVDRLTSNGQGSTAGGFSL